MKMKKEKFRIGELADKLGVERFVIRFWEKEFALISTRSSGGQRFYDEDDYATFLKIKELLYNQGFTIQGAKKVITNQTKSSLTPLESTTNSKFARKTEWNEQLASEVGSLKKQLEKLRELL